MGAVARVPGRRHDGAAAGNNVTDGDHCRFVDYLVQVVERRPNPSALRWCATWWAHPEALSRIYALWRAWEGLRQQPDSGLSGWWVHHLDRHLDVLTHAEGPFGRCRPGGHREPSLWTAEPMPEVLRRKLPGLPPVAVPPDGGDADDAIGPAFTTLDDFMTAYLLMVLEARQTPGCSGWCARWWAHPEAVTRLHALWQAWEYARAHADPAGMSTWWRDSLDFQLAALLDPAGPFGRCGHGTHRDPAPLPVEPISAEVLLQLPE